MSTLSRKDSIERIEDSPDSCPTATLLNVFLLGLGMKIGGCTIAWNYGLIVGFGEYFLTVFVLGIGYLFLGLCVAEMFSIIPFSGGYYGYVRCVLGPFLGYMVGCCGICESTFQMAVSILKIGQFVTAAFDISQNFEPLWWLLIFITVLACHVFAAKWFWNWISVVASIGILLVFIYLFGTMPHLNFHHNAGEVFAQHDDNNFFSVFRLAVLFFLGFDLLTVTSNDIIRPKVVIPKVIITLIICLIILATWLMITVVSQSPGLITPELYQHSTMFPLVYGYELIFGITRRQALVLCIIPSFATPLGYMFVIGKQIQSMALSGLLPQILKETITPKLVPFNAMIAASIFAYLGLLYSWLVNPYTTLSRFATLGGCIVYILMFSCYIVCNYRYPQLPRSFRNPLGIYSAYIGILIFGASLFIMLFLSSDIPLTTVLFFLYVLFAIVYYYVVAETQQGFSADEQKLFFKVYIANLKTRQELSILQRMTSDLSALFVNLRALQGAPKVDIDPEDELYDEPIILRNNSNGGSSRRVHCAIIKDDCIHHQDGYASDLRLIDEMLLHEYEHELNDIQEIDELVMENQTSEYDEEGLELLSKK